MIETRGAQAVSRGYIDRGIREDRHALGNSLWPIIDRIVDQTDLLAILGPRGENPVRAGFLGVARDFVGIFKYGRESNEKRYRVKLPSGGARVIDPVYEDAKWVMEEVGLTNSSHYVRVALKVAGRALREYEGTQAGVRK